MEILVRYTNIKNSNLEILLKEKKIINVVFFPANISMWKNSSLIKLMLSNPRFNPVIVSAMPQNQSVEDQKRNQEEMKSYFKSKGFPFIPGYDFDNQRWFDVKKELSPDLIFYTQPYQVATCKKYYFKNFKKSLLVYVPYGFSTINTIWNYNSLYHNLAWKNFFSIESHKIYAEKLSTAKGKNVVITGNAIADEFLDPDRKIKWEWKLQDRSIKRIIYAPHHSIYDEGSLTYSTFLECADEMIELAERYRNRVQFIFKPHPMLKSKLIFNVSDWGKERTENYYRKWAEMGNTAISEGDYVDIFLTSDAMIHDCSTFTAEYHYTKKPVMYITKQGHEDSLCEFGKMAFNLHYKGENIKDIEDFIEKIVINGKDDLKGERENLFNNYLQPPNNKTAAQNMIDEIEKYI